MSTSTNFLIVRLGNGRRVDVQVGNHLVHTDQPTDKGGEDAAPSPFDLFLASLGACAGVFVQGFCANRKIDTRGIHLTEHPTFDENGVLSAVRIEVVVPESFPERYRDALIRVVERCSVKQAIAAQPVMSVQVHSSSDNAVRQST